MSSETSRVEAAARAAHEAGDWDVTWTGDDWRAEVGRLEATAALAASDADDLANGIRRVRVDAMEAVQEQVNLMYAAAKQGESLFGENTASDHLRHFADNIGAVLAAATDGVDG
ncbi:hypothetical protein [Pseudarthrobacter sp. MEB009]|uniref:hypothetical protein n=1 Tax=Pseudarthrobacter sp. MEB009 TaxID=3040326 RepID=UPI0025538AEC|nr:hypothetical protein [Pseudarthrobacter sp. MEB009]